MKTTKKILAVIMTIVMLLSAVPMMAGAKGSFNPQSATKAQAFSKDKAKPNDLWEDGELTIDKKVYIEPGQKVTIDKIPGAEVYDYYELQAEESIIKPLYNQRTYSLESFIGLEFGVSVVTVCGYVEDFNEYFNEYDYEYVGEYTLLIVVKDIDGMGQVTGLETYDQTYNYKDDAWVDCWVDTKNDDYAYWATIYVSSEGENDPYVCYDGQIATYLTGSTYCTVYVVDAQGHIFEDSCTITVKYSFWQWLIRIFLFGWLWY
ncbi:MAG: hypothetical protein KBT46_05405 [Ruminococcus sp.]|nr:hypothetical protein [Candidatus Copronaster equi]